MRTAPLVALGIAAYAIFVAATVPARWVAAQAESRTRNTVRVHEANGTLWHGAARADVAIPGSGWLPMDNVAWRWQPAELLRGRLAFEVDAQASGLAARGTLARGLSMWHASGEASASAAFASTVAPILSTWRPEGRLALRTDGFAWDEREARGDVQAEWSDATIALSQVRPLGTYRASLHAEGTGAKLAVTTIDGALRLTGNGDIVFPSRFVFNGEARAQGPNAAALDPLLDLMGPRRPDGSRTLAWRTS
jgi:general secretion pathway protein N